MNHRRLFFILFWVLVGAGIAVAGTLITHTRLSFASDSYQAVFLSNNQVYFGKLSKADSPYPVLSDVYYIQAFAAQDLSSAEKSNSQLQLVKLGSELHQPQDTMYLNREQILFIEPLKSDSRIVSSIRTFKKNQTP